MLPPVFRRSALFATLGLSLLASGPLSGLPAGGAVLHDVRLEQLEPFRWELRLVSSAELDLVGIRGSEDGLSIQLPLHEPAPELRDLAFAEGLVEAIRLRVETTSRGPNVRILVDSRKPLSYALRTEGATARIGLWPRELEPPEDELRRRVETLRTELTRVRSSRKDLASRLAVLSDDQRRIREAFQVSESRRETLRPRLEAALDDAGTSLRDLASELEATRARLAGAEGREAALRAEVAALEEKFFDARAEASDVLADQRARIDRLEAENSRLLDELALRDRQLLELRTGTPDPGGDGPGAATRDRPESVDVPGLGPAGGRGSESERRVEERPDPGLGIAEVVEPGDESREDGAGRIHLVVVATELETERVERKAEEVRGRGYTGEIYRSSGGYLLVLLDRLPYREAIRLRDEAIANGDAPADTYLIPID